jgi:DNA-binding response OmpR family regulator
VFDSFSSYAKAKNIDYRIDHLNPSETLWVDKVHFEKILSNILSNAFKYTPENGRILVRTKSLMEDAIDWFEIRIYNSGSYISEEDIPHVFERFFQANNVTNETIGSGIGLNLVNELVNLHHGTINVHNMEPDGVEFVLRFPLHKIHLTEEELSPRGEEDSEFQTKDDLFANIEMEQETDEESDNVDKTKKTVLVVDDDKNLCLYIKTQISDAFNVFTANSGNEAWQEILKTRPDAVVTDIRMPDGNGIELSKRIKSNPETDSIPIIMLTSENSDMAEINSLNLQVDHFISKPFNVLKLKSAIIQGIKVREKMMGKMRRTEVDYDYTEKTIDSADDKLFARINESLKKNLDDSSFGVNELANIVGISRVHLNRKMKDRYGVSPNNFIRSYRLKQAAYLLINNNVNVSEVAYRVGFSSHSHFSNTFRDYFGMTPKEFIAYYSEYPDDNTLMKLLE